MLDEETTALNEGKPGLGGLMTSFVRALDMKQKEDAKGSASSAPKGLMVDEIFGNIFVMNFAGHDGHHCKYLGFQLITSRSAPRRPRLGHGRASGAYTGDREVGV